MASDLWAGTKLDMKVRGHPEIVTTFFGAILGVVTTLNLLGEAYPESKYAFEKLEEALKQLIECNEVLQEWKDLHHELQGYFLNLRGFALEVSWGYYNSEVWDARHASWQWRSCKLQMDELKFLAQRLKRIRTKEFQENGVSLRGDAWIVEIMRAGRDVEARLKEEALDDLYECTDRLCDACEKHLRFVDGEIRQLTSSMSKILYGALGGGVP